MKINFEGSPEELKALVSIIAPCSDIVDAIVDKVANNIASDNSSGTEEDLTMSIAEVQKAHGINFRELENPYISMHR